MEPLAFTLDGYNHGAQHALIRKDLYPLWMRKPLHILFVILAIWVLAANLAPETFARLGNIPLVVPAACLVYLFTALFLAHTRNRAFLLQNLGYTGPAEIRIADDGLHYSGLHYRSHVDWQGITSARMGKDSILIMAGPSLYYPLPAHAFTDAAHMAATLTDLQTRIAAAKGA